jgi:hypothetical protein
MQQTPAQKRAKQKHRQIKTRAYAAIKQMAEAAGMTVEEFLDWLEGGEWKGQGDTLQDDYETCADMMNAEFPELR